MRAIYPGCFDPITYGHLDIINRASNLFDELIVLIIDNKDKNITYSLDKRYEMVKLTTAGISNVSIDTYDKLLTSYIKDNNISVIVRGVRNATDFEYESSLLEIYKTQQSNIESVLLSAKPKYAYLSSTVVRQHAYLNGDLSHFVPNEIESIIREVYN